LELKALGYKIVVLAVAGILPVIDQGSPHSTRFPPAVYCRIVGVTG
jgi:hypothetical protein